MIRFRQRLKYHSKGDMPLDSIVSVEVNISIDYNKIDRKIDVTAILILLVETTNT